MKVNGMLKPTREMVRVAKSGLMVQSMRDTGRTIKQMEKVV